MDTATLVEEQIDEGQRFVDHLQKQAGFDVSAAFWAHTSEDGLWFLYIASPTVDNGDLASAYRRVYGEISRAHVQWISRPDIKLIGSNDPIAVDAAAIGSAIFPTKYRGRKLGDLIIEEAHIYPKNAPS